MFQVKMSTDVFFQLFGHKNVSVLDGGFEKWVEKKYPTTQDEPKPEVSVKVGVVSHVKQVQNADF